MVDTGEWRVVGDGLKGDGPVPSVGAAHFPAEHCKLWLMPASWQRSFMTAYLGEMGGHGGVTQTGSRGRGIFLTPSLGNLFHMVIVSKCNDLPRSNIASAWVGIGMVRKLKLSSPETYMIT